MVFAVPVFLFLFNNYLFSAERNYAAAYHLSSAGYYIAFNVNTEQSKYLMTDSEKIFLQFFFSA